MIQKDPNKNKEPYVKILVSSKGLAWIDKKMKEWGYKKAA
jgi:hypothetical protein